MNNFFEHMGQLETKHLRKILFYVFTVLSAVVIYLVDLAEPLGILPICSSCKKIVTTKDTGNELNSTSWSIRKLISAMEFVLNV